MFQGPSLQSTALFPLDVSKHITCGKLCDSSIAYVQQGTVLQVTTIQTLSYNLRASLGVALEVGMVLDLTYWMHVTEEFQYWIGDLSRHIGSCCTQSKTAAF